MSLDDLPFPAVVVGVIVIALSLLVNSLAMLGVGRDNPCDWRAILDETAKNLPSKVAGEIRKAEVELWREALLSAASDPTQVPEWEVLEGQDRVTAVVAYVAERVAENREEAYSEAVREAIEESLKDAVRSCLDSVDT